MGVEYSNQWTTDVSVCWCLQCSGLSWVVPGGAVPFILCFVFVKKQRTIERKKKRSKISGLESCCANRIYVLIGVELRPYGQKLVKFCTHTHTRVSYIVQAN